MRTNISRRSWVIYCFLKACITQRVLPLRYFYVHLDYLDAASKIYSKQSINESIPNQWRLKSTLLSIEESRDIWKDKIESQFTYPLFLKPEWGENSSGVFRVHDRETLLSVLSKIQQTKQNYICQEAASGEKEYDFFFVKSHEKEKEFPDIFSCIRMEPASLVGDGKTTLQELFQIQSPQLSPETCLLSNYNPLDVLPRDKKLRLSFINGVNHGTRYVSETENLSPLDKKNLWKHLQSLGDFQFARVGISANSLRDIIDGAFQVIEINLFTPFPLDVLDLSLSNKEQRQILQSYMNTLLKTVKQKNNIPPRAFWKVLQLLLKKKKILTLHNNV